jgi:hypothetical protein
MHKINEAPVMTGTAKRGVGIIGVIALASFVFSSCLDEPLPLIDPVGMVPDTGSVHTVPTPDPAEKALGSGTLPVVYINTAGGAAIVSKTDYVDATYWIRPAGAVDFDAVGKAESQLPLQIRGHGNYTWSLFEKKPYRLKLARGQSLLGMNSGRHFVLLAHADDKVAFLRNTVGFELSRRMGLPFTPEQQPVEVVLNGDYIGLYFLTENIRVDTSSVNIVEQENGETDLERVTGGWLVEIDNNRADNQLELDVKGIALEWLWVTYHSPDELSAVQRDYLYNQFEAIKKAVYMSGKSSTAWEELIDIESLARFYIIQEVLDHTEAFLGSCYLWKDRGDQRWKFGPVWDFGHAFTTNHSKNQFIYNATPFPVSIIKKLATFPRFQEEVKRVWQEFYPDKLAGIEDFMTAFLDRIAAAAAANAERWPQYGNGNVYEAAQPAFDCLHTKVDWLNRQWRE